MSIRPSVQAAAAYRFSAKPHRVKLDQNESPYDLPDDLKTRVLERLSDVVFNRYPDMQADALKAKLAAYHGWSADELVMSGGSNILIQSLVTAAGLGQDVLTVSPTFAVYQMQAELLDARFTAVPLESDFSLSMEAFKEKLATGKGVFFLAIPAAPTGNLFPEDEILELIEAARENWLVVLDEAYYQFSGTDFSGLTEKYPHVVVLRTFSKAFGLGGVRLGYARMNPELAVHIQKTVMPFSISALQLCVGEVVLESPEFVEARVAEALQERERMFTAMQAMSGIDVYPSHTNFFLFKVADPASFYDALLAEGVLIRRQDHLLDGCLRVSIGKPEENSAFLDAAQRITQEKVVAHV